MPNTYKLPAQTGAAGKWRIALLAAAIGLPLLLFAAVATEDRHAVLQDATQNVASTTAIFAEHAHNVFQTHSLIAGQVDEHIRGMTWDEIASSPALHDYLAGLARDYVQLQSLWLIDASGTIRASSIAFPIPPVNSAERDYFIALRAHDTGVFIGPLVTGRISGRNIFNLARRRSSASGAFDGVVVISAMPSYLTDFWQQTIQRRGGAVSLIRRDGAFLARLPTLPAAARVLAPDSPLMRAIAASDTGAFRSVSTVDGKERIYAYRKMADFPLYIGYGINLSAALAPWRAHLVYYGLFFALGSAGLGLLSMFAIRRARSEAAALSVASRFRGLIEAAPDPMIVVRKDGRISLVNNQALTAFGYTAEEMVGKPIEDLISERFRQHHLSRRADYVAAPHKREMGVGLPLFALRKDGSEFPVDVSLSPLEIDGEPLVLALVRDITARRQMEADIETSRMQLVASARMSALGAMAGGIAHEINNPLMVIHASATDLLDLAEEGDVPRDEVLRSSERIAQYSDRITRIVKSMLHLSRDGSKEHMSPIRLGAVVDEALDLCRQRFRDREVELIVAPEGMDSIVTCRSVQIAQVLVNLLQNALDAVMPQEGARWVRLEAVEQAGRVTLSVIDSGPGIPPDLAARIMDPFFTTKPVGQGTGLGLSISRQIAAEHGGALEVLVKDGHTCFSLSLISTPGGRTA